MIWELQMIYEDVSMDAQYMDAVKREDMETAQRMVDAAAKNAGFTMKGDHGSVVKNFERFDPTKQGTTTDGGLFSKGFYFFRTGGDAARNSAYPNKRTFFLKITNPYHIAISDRSLRDASVKEQREGRTAKILQKEGFDGVMVWNVSGRYPELKNAKGIDRESQPRTQDIEYLREMVVYDPSRIKSADPVTYKNNKPIPLSERFNQSTDNIKY